MIQAESAGGGGSGTGDYKDGGGSQVEAMKKCKYTERKLHWVRRKIDILLPQTAASARRVPRSSTSTSFAWKIMVSVIENVILFIIYVLDK